MSMCEAFLLGEIKQVTQIVKAFSVERERQVQGSKVSGSLLGSRAMCIRGGSQASNSLFTEFHPLPQLHFQPMPHLAPCLTLTHAVDFILNIPPLYDKIIFTNNHKMEQ